MCSEQHVRDIAKRLVELEATLEAVKPLYAERDKLTLELVKLEVKTIPLTFLEDERMIEVVDNFAEKNTVFRPAGVRRFEVKIK